MMQKGVIDQGQLLQACRINLGPTTSSGEKSFIINFLFINSLIPEDGISRLCSWGLYIAKNNGIKPLGTLCKSKSPTIHPYPVWIFFFSKRGTSLEKELKVERSETKEALNSSRSISSQWRPPWHSLHQSQCFPIRSSSVNQWTIKYVFFCQVKDKVLEARLVS